MKPANPILLSKGAFLAALLIGGLSLAIGAETEMLDVERDELKFGFIKLTDMAPLAVAYEKG